MRDVLKAPYFENMKSNFRKAVKYHDGSEWDWLDEGFFVERKKIEESEINKAELNKFKKEKATSERLVSSRHSVVMISDKSPGKNIHVFDCFVDGRSCDFKKLETKADDWNLLKKAIERNFYDAVHGKNAYSAAIEIDDLIGEKKSVQRFGQETYERPARWRNEKNIPCHERQLIRARFDKGQIKK